MARLIRRYGGGSRKLYDTEASRYVSLDEVAGLVRAGEEVRVVESRGGEDVTGQVLAQIIHEGEKRGERLLHPTLLHDIIRRGEEALAARVEQLRAGADRLVRGTADHLPPVRDMRDEFEALQHGLEALEASLARLEAGTDSEAGTPAGSRRNRPPRRP